VPTRPNRRVATLLAAAFPAIALLAAVAGCASTPADGNAPPPDVDCPGEPVPTDLTVTCHQVPVDTASLAVALLRSPDPTGAPILFLHGGPGGRAVADRHRWLTPRSELLDDHDLVLVDQRGGGHSTPSMDCPEMERSQVGDGSLSGDRACRERLTGDGLDPASVSVGRIAADLVAVRHALGIDRWHLHGVSFGTRVALELVRIDEPAVLSMVLDSVVPPDADETADLPDGIVAALGALQAHCTDDGSCPAGILGPLRGILDQLHLDPVGVQVDDRSRTVDDTTFLAAAVRTLGRPDGPTVVPRALMLAGSDRLAEAMALLSPTAADTVGDTRASTRTGTVDGLAEGAWAAITCGDQLPGMSFEPADVADPIHRAEHGRWTELRARCAAWDVPPTPRSTREPVRTSVPALILAGEMDPITPPIWAHRVARHLHDSTVVASPAWTHAPSTWNPCAAHLVARFLATGERPAGPTPDC